MHACIAAHGIDAYVQRGCTLAFTDWPDRISHAGQSAVPPWGEIVGQLVTITLPGERALALGHSGCRRVAEYWDSVVLSHYSLRLGGDKAALAQAARDAVDGRVPQQRITFDVQVTCLPVDEEGEYDDGGLHSGYPAVGHLPHVDAVVGGPHDPAEAWGFYHELGHNFQRDAWTFDGSVEVCFLTVGHSVVVVRHQCVPVPD